MKTKIKSYGDGTIDFFDKEIPKAGCNHTYLSVIRTVVLKKEESYYLQVYTNTLKKKWLGILFKI